MAAEMNIDLELSADEQALEKKIRKLRVLIGETAKTKNPEEAETLSIYLEMAGDKILERLYPFRQPETVDGEEVWPEKYVKVPTKYEMLQLKIAAYLLNKRGAEGEVQHIENGVHRNYGDSDVPEAMLTAIAPFIGIPK